MHLQQYIFISLSLPSLLSSFHTCDEQRQYEEDGRCCEKCPPGEHMKNRCTPAKPTECVRCSDETFTKRHNTQLNCQPCQGCTMPGLLYQSQCSRTSDAVCKCEPGLQCTGESCQGCERIPDAPEHPTHNEGTKTQISTQSAYVTVSVFDRSVKMAVNPTGHDLLHVITKHSKEGHTMSLAFGFIALCLLLAVLLPRKTGLRWIKSRYGVWTIWKPCTVYRSTELEEVPMPVQEESGKVTLPLDI